MPALRQSSFVGGEISPYMYGRDDLEPYQFGVKLAENFIITKQGALLSRGGFGMIQETKDPTRDVILYPFHYTSTTDFILEFGSTATGSYIRFYKDGAPVLDGGAAVFEMTGLSNVANLRFKQEGNTLFIVGAGLNGKIHQLVHDGFNDYDWTLEEVDFKTLVPYHFSFPVIREPVEGETSTYKAQKWTYQLTRVYEHPFGYLFESAPVTIELTAQFENPPVGDPPFDRLLELFKNNTGAQSALTKKGKFVIEGVAPLEIQFDDWNVNLATGEIIPVPDPPYPIRSTRIYRGRGQLMGLVGEELYPTYQFTDYGKEPNYLEPPPTKIPPFATMSNGVVTYSESPRAIGSFEQRMILASSLSWPGLMWFSESNNYLGFNRRYFPTDKGAFPVQLTSRVLEAILFFASLDKLLIFTTAGVWVLSGSEQALSPMNLPLLREISQVGCSRFCQPLVVGDSVIYVSNTGTAVYDLTYNDNRGGYIGGDLSYLAKHLFVGHEITASADARDPYGISFYRRDDGILLVHTYDKNYNISGWSRITTDGAIQSIATAIENKEHVLYAVISRTVGGVTKRFVERMSTRTITSVADAMCLDCAVTKYIGGSTFTTVNVPHLVGRTVGMVGDGAYMGTTIVPVDGVVTLPRAASKAFVGLPYSCKMQMLDLAGGLQVGAARTKQKTVNMATFEVIDSLGLRAGEDFNNLKDWQPRQVSDGFNPIPLRSGQVEVYIPHSYSRTGEVVLQQDLPHPVTVVAVTRNFDIGD